MKLYTKVGDDGLTALYGGARVSKDDPRVCAYGEVDEANAAIGMAMAAGTDEETAAALRCIQSDLFVLGGELASPSGKSSGVSIDEHKITRLEHWIDEASAEVPPLQQFVLPGGTATAAALHLARTICRRAERAVVCLARQQDVSAMNIIYMNRLSDLLFVLARRANHRAGVADVPWVAPRK